jgi:predicted DNA-binding transcriptional regulator AlpA
MAEHRTIPPELIFAPEISAKIPYSSNHLRRLESQGDFPRRIRIGANRIAWLRDEVEQWLADRVGAR